MPTVLAMLALREAAWATAVDAAFVFEGPTPSRGFARGFASHTRLHSIQRGLNQPRLEDTSMILTIPHQAFEIGNIHVMPFQVDKYGKTIARLMYKDNSIDFHDVSILSPPMRILDYHTETSRLRLDVSDHPQFQSKINMLHDYLISTFYTHQQSFLNERGKTYDAIRRLFYFLLDGSALSLFIYPTALVQRESGMCRVSDLKPGDVVRCVIRLQGVSQLIHREALRLRLHHSVPSLYFIKRIMPPPGLRVDAPVFRPLAL